VMGAPVNSRSLHGWTSLHCLPHDDSLGLAQFLVSNAAKDITGGSMVDLYMEELFLGESITDVSQQRRMTTILHLEDMLAAEHIMKNQ
jgi:hypothetical protein